MVLGNLAGVASVLWFGLSGSFAWALGARVFGGLLNAIIGGESV